MTTARPDDEAIFHAARDIPDLERRREYVREACGGDETLIAHVEALLAAADAPDSLLDRPPEGDPVATIDQPATESPGTVIGPYKLLEKIGEGGMGTVWMAQQTEPVKRLVAVKLIKAGMDSKQVIARFEAERQALALMDHPNIAKVLDAGTVGQVSKPADVDDRIGILSHIGRPYFVMDLVKGAPITKYCDGHQLTPRQRLELFLPVCQAVQHAHQKGIIHRDLKPSNVLVALYDGKPVPKVIDFGVAKAAGQPLTDKTLVTGFGALVGTLEYMSPEQAEVNQLDIDTRSDIYSLGVLLYELLAGSPPFTKKDLEKAGMLEMLRVIREDEPSKPSTKLSTAEGLPTLAANRGTEPAKLTKLVRGELDWIVMKALEKDRNRRYETANGFAMDVQRYLADEAVQAGPPSARYRFRKFVRRNKGPVLATSLVFVALVGGVIGTSWGLVRADHARQGEEEQRLAAEASAGRAVKAQERAEQGFDKAKESVEQYLRAVTEDPDLKHKYDLHALRKRLLQAAVPFYQWFTEQKPGDAALEAERSRAYHRLARVRTELGETEAALKDYERMQAIVARLAADFPGVPEYRRELAMSHTNLGALLADLGQRPAAEQAYRRTLDLFEKLVADFPTVAEYRRGLAMSHNNLGILLKDLGQRPAAEQAYRRALELFEKLVADFPTVAEYRRGLAMSHNNLGMLLKDLGQRPAAEQAHRRAVELAEKLVADFPAVPEYRRDLAKGHNGLGNLLADLGRLAAAEQAYRRALEIQEKLAAEFPTVPEYRRDLANSHNNLGIVLKDPGQRPAAERAYRRALEIQEKLAADFPTVPLYRRELALSYNNLAILLAKLEQRPAAEKAYRQALDLFEKLAADFPSVAGYRRELAAGYLNFGILVRNQGQAEASLAWLAKAIALFEPLLQQEPRLVTERIGLRSAHQERAKALDKLGRHADAVKDWDRALSINPEPQYEPYFRRNRARSLAHAGEHTKAVAEANALAEANDVTSSPLYDLACVCAIAAAKVKDPKTPAADATRFAEQYAARAVELLRQALAKGYKDAAHLKMDEALDALRHREDFKKLVAELEAKRE
jgi:serine/threonine protein kinase/tetratricopeptide (TPR) repeat protein